jgi:hypothetical protein
MVPHQIKCKLEHCWVRQLIGKPGGYTSPDCEFEARRIHKGRTYAAAFSLAAESKTFRTHSDLLCGDLAIAACNSRFSSGDRRALTIIPRSLDFATLGLPILGFIKYFA